MCFFFSISLLQHEDAGDILADSILMFLDEWREFVPNGLSECNYSSDDVPVLIQTL